MFKWIFSALLLPAAPLLCWAETRVDIEEGEILYHGELTKEANEAVFDLYNRQNIKPSTLTITSRGGPVDRGLELGEWVHKHGLNVKVYDLCFSSCANYVFPAGRRKLLDKDALVGFHGGATSNSFDTSSLEAAIQAVPEEQRERLRRELEVSMKSYIQINAQREAEFYRTLGVSPKLNTLGQSKQYEEFRQGYDGWVYTPEDMKILGLSNIEMIDDPRPAELAHKPKVFPVKLAPKSTLMQPIGLPVPE